MATYDRFAAAQAQPAVAGEIAPFAPGNVTDAARALAAKPFKALASDLPDPFANLSYEAYSAIRTRPEGRIWSGDPTGFAIEPLHRGFIFSAPMQINLVESGMTRRLTYDQSMFNFGDLKTPPNLKNLDFSGFRILLPQGDGALRETAIFQGASFFRALARGQSFGATARALSIRTADPRGEEFPFFRAIWIEKPTLAANALTIHALLDSESVSGAYRFTLHPGDATIIDTECTLFARAPIDNLGVATMSAIGLFGPIDRRKNDDVRVAVAETGGLQLLTGRNEWVWRPVSNRESLQISAFVDENPKGFGFLQRDRDFDHYQDDDQHWENKPSLWIEPIGDWGPGAVQLIEIPSDSESAQNIIAYWRPKAPLAAGQEARFAYRQFWCWNPPSSPDLAFVQGVRGGRGQSGKRRRFLVDFRGDIFADAARVPDVKANLTGSPGALVATRVFLSRERKSCRILFEIDPGSENSCEMRLVLESAGAPISETWLYRWTP